ncbi:MAG: hypothetical protein IPM67_09760 [Sphingomonadales bacterium]|nr:hypothetical protein [Sphingomonadales bacterium]MBK9268908.1 hypothetical protein [Sphingomonadales bacterium]
MRQESAIETGFWRWWLSGLMLFALMIALNPSISNNVAPMGISDHQAAATAARVNAIQAAWQTDGVLWLARLSMAIDLVFIGVYSRGAWLGGKVMRAEAGQGLRKLGLAIIAVAALFCLTDYIETVSQFIQAMRFEGNDALAGLAAAVRPVKTVAFLVTFTGLLAALLFRRMARRDA